jgi:hypothetical protein
MAVNQNDVFKAEAAPKGYADAVVLVFFLYLLLWIPGLVANVFYLRQARRMERLTGTSLTGTGWLVVQLVFGVGTLLFALLIGVVYAWPMLAGAR